MSSLYIKNVKIINADGITDAKDVLVEGGKISKISHDLKSSAKQTIDAKGRILVPGLIDIHVHLRVPGQEYKETIETGSAAAVKGGFTTVMCMPNTIPAIDNKAIVESIINESKRVGICNIIPIGAITKARADQELVDMFELKEAGCLALSDDGKSVVNSQLMKQAMIYSKMMNLLLIQHCEDPSLSAHGVMNEGLMSTVLGLKGDAGISETVIISRDIEIANYTKGRVHFAHISTRRSAELIQMAKKQKINVTCEVCPHHFALTEEALKTFDTNAKVNPPLRTQDDVEAMKEYIKNGTIDCIVTDHAPHSAEEKENDMDGAPFGMIGLETSLGLAVKELIETKIIGWPKLVELMSTRPAELIGLTNKGKIAEGYDADLTLIDPDEVWEVRRQDIVSKSKNTPFYGWKLKGRVKATVFNGRVVYQE